VSLSAGSDETTTPLVTARGVHLAFGPTPVLEGADIDLWPGRELAIVGRSGSGKTSLLLVLAGLLEPTEGQVRWPGLSTDPDERRAEIAMVFQSPSLLPELTALENTCLPLRLRGRTIDEAREAALGALSLMGLEEALGALPAQLSGGQQQRVAVARALAGRPRLILADEPTGSLDRDHASQVISALRDRARADGSCLVLSTHDEQFAGMLGSRATLEDRSLRWPVTA
jgi:putative ABC transport system ATP-binding protein